MNSCRFLEPLDVLILRGNKLFGDPGSYGEALIPPWPSVAAGAIRSQMLAEQGIDFFKFARGNIQHPELGTPQAPGSFELTGFYLGQRGADGEQSLHPLPADCVVFRDESGLSLRRMHPAAPPVSGSNPLPMWPLLRTDKQRKAISGVWLNQTGWQKYLQGETPAEKDLIESAALWKVDHRVGVGLSATSRSAEDGKLFSTQAISLLPGYGFLVTVQGAEPPTGGILRLGGDGRGATVSEASYKASEPDYEKMVEKGRCRVVLTTPGIFSDGWRLEGTDSGNEFHLGGITAKLVCAAVPRAETASGWDLAAMRPKAAHRMVPAGSVFWLDSLDATPDQLRKLVEHGLWPQSDYDANRKAEGFNRFSFAIY